ncbi:hypothetical protein BC827DRAFT_1182708 [Russula dissimulans]|nr:hypothetical protein BC827DRAFT_1182708 [Russula dissimulans]
MSRRSGNKSNHHNESPAFANFFSDDVSDDYSTFYPSMYDDMRDQAFAGTAVPRRRLRKLLLLSMGMTLGMAVLSVHSMRIFSRIGWIALSQNHEEMTNKILVHLSAQLVAAGILNSTSFIPLPEPPQSCNLPWLYGSVLSLTCALGALQTIARVRNDSKEHAREEHAIRIGLGSAGVLFCIGILKFFL